MLVELLSNLDHHLRGGSADGSDGERGEQERHGPPDQQPDQDVGMIDPHTDEIEPGPAQRHLERPEQRRRRQYRGGDGHPLGDGLRGVSHRVEAGHDLVGPLPQPARHLGDAVRVVRDRTVGVHRHDDPHRGEHAHPGERDEVQPLRRVVAKVERRDDRPADHQDRPHGRLEAGGEAREDRGRGTGQR